MSTEPAAVPTSPSRLLALDAFRGATILGMILVNNPGTWGTMYWPLAHAEWHGWTPTDLVFPFFVFIVGTALAYSLRKYRTGTTIDSAVYARIIRRSLLLVGLGLGLGLFGRVCDMIWSDAESLKLATLRWPGVLQRIGLVYGCASLLVLLSTWRQQVAVAVALLIGYWGLLATLPASEPSSLRFEPEHNVVRAVDMAVIGTQHMYTQATSEPTDPEGLLSTLPAVVTALLGYWCGLFIQHRGATGRTVALLIASGLAVAALGQLWHTEFPINKKLWTSSFVLLTGGLGAASLGLSLAVCDIWRWAWVARPLQVVGINAITAYAGSSLLAQLLESIPLGDRNVQTVVYENAFAGPIGIPELASLAYALVTVAVWWVVLAVMARVGWVFKL